MRKQNFRIRMLKAGIFFSFLACYLEWGKGQGGFIFQLEFDVLFRKADVMTFRHPFILLPLAGQMLLLISTLLNAPARKITLLGICLTGMLSLIVLLIGVLSLNLKILFSAIPFVILSILYIAVSGNRKGGGLRAFFAVDNSETKLKKDGLQ